MKSFREYLNERNLNEGSGDVFRLELKYKDPIIQDYYEKQLKAMEKTYRNLNQARKFANEIFANTDYEIAILITSHEDEYTARSQPVRVNFNGVRWQKATPALIKKFENFTE